MAKGKKIPEGTAAVWWCSVIGSVMVIAVAIPAMPWRYNRVDTNCGNRFVMERYYYLTGLTNNLGKTEGWMSIRRKIQRKTEEFGRPSPLVAIAGTVSQSIGFGGAATGCPMWMVCKEHTSARFTNYTTIAYSSFAFIGCAVLQALCSAGVCVYLGFEQADIARGKKKKKKDDECMDLTQKTASFAVWAFLFAFGVVAGFVLSTLIMFKNFKMTAYYPFAGAHIAPFVGGIGCILLFVSCFKCVNRVYKCCGYKRQPQDGEWGGEWDGGAYDGGYGRGGYHGQPQW